MWLSKRSATHQPTAAAEAYLDRVLEGHLLSRVGGGGHAHAQRTAVAVARRRRRQLGGEHGGGEGSGRHRIAVAKVGHVTSQWYQMAMTGA